MEMDWYVKYATEGKEKQTSKWKVTWVTEGKDWVAKSELTYKICEISIQKPAINAGALFLRSWNIIAVFLEEWPKAEQEIRTGPLSI